MHITKENYPHLKKLAHDNPDEFWLNQAKRLNWKTFPTKAGDSSFYSPVSIKWYEDGTLNVCENCVDRHKNKQKDAIIWVSDDGETLKRISYQDLYLEVNAMAYTLQKLGVKKGDPVIIYMPQIPEAAYAMLACARLGAIHSVVFGGFSPESLRSRIEDSKARFLITADEGLRGSKKIHLKKNVDEALENDTTIEKVLVIPYAKSDLTYFERDIIYTPQYGIDVEPEVMKAEDPLFILYTSGSTGKPKGVLHTSGGYLVYASLTHEWIFDVHEADVYWCTADVGWITGHTYGLYGPLANGTTSVMFEGIPTYPNPDIFWKIIDKIGVNIFYTAPTAIRSLLQQGDDWLKTSSRKSLRVLGSVGEPINDEAWKWFFEKVGHSICPIVDTWWQTETGGILVTPLPFMMNDLKPSSAMSAFFGITPILLNDQGEQSDKGNLCIKTSWPGQMRTVFGKHDLFEKTYFSKFKGYYFSGDGAYLDQDKHLWITGRVDDVLNVSGHRLGTAELETAATSNHDISEAAVVGIPHPIKGEGIMVFAIASIDTKKTDDDLKDLIKKEIRSHIGPIATPDEIVIVPGLPKTRSGKIMRRILRALARKDFENIGDISTLADPLIVEIIKSKV
ncbi:MAG: Acetyl-coenzyme A synthetase [Holosporales bacterium]